MLCDTLFEQSYQESTSKRKMKKLPKLKKNKRGVAYLTKLTIYTTFVFSPTTQKIDHYNDTQRKLYNI